MFIFFTTIIDYFNQFSDLLHVITNTGTESALSMTTQKLCPWSQWLRKNFVRGVNDYAKTLSVESTTTQKLCPWSQQLRKNFVRGVNGRAFHRVRKAWKSRYTGPLKFNFSLLNTVHFVFIFYRYNCFLCDYDMCDNCAQKVSTRVEWFFKKKFITLAMLFKDRY